MNTVECTKWEKERIFQALCAIRKLLIAAIHRGTIYHWDLPGDAEHVRKIANGNGPWRFHCGNYNPGGSTFSCKDPGGKRKYGRTISAPFYLIVICKRTWEEVDDRHSRAHGCAKGRLARLLAHEMYHAAGHSQEDGADKFGKRVYAVATQYAYPPCGDPNVAVDPRWEYEYCDFHHPRGGTL